MATTLSLKHWTEISDDIKALKPDLYEVMNSFAKKLRNNYLHVLEIPFGIDLITKGYSSVFEPGFIKQCEFTGNSKQNNPDIFFKSFSNKNDHPLGIIQEGIVEIYEKNEYSLLQRGDFKYDFPLRVLNEKELIGTFGATDLICKSDFGKHYSYSASCGHHSIYSLLPKTDVDSRGTLKAKLWSLFREYNLKFTEGQEVFYYLPQLIKKMHLSTDKKVKIILIPDFWYNTRSFENSELRGYISGHAWLQLRESVINNLKITPIMKEISALTGPKTYIVSEMIVYLQGILAGTQFALKPVDEKSYLNQIYLTLREKLDGEYDPLLFYYDVLQKGEWGIFPLITFPTLNPIPALTNAKDFLKTMQSAITQLPEFLSHNNNLNYYLDEPKKFISDHFPKKNLYTEQFLIRAILKVQRS